MVQMDSFPPFLISATHLENNKLVMHQVLHECDLAKLLEELVTLDDLSRQYRDRRSQQEDSGCQCREERQWRPLATMHTLCPYLASTETGNDALEAP